MNQFKVIDTTRRSAYLNSGLNRVDVLNNAQLQMADLATEQEDVLGKACDVIISMVALIHHNDMTISNEHIFATICDKLQAWEVKKAESSSSEIQP